MKHFLYTGIILLLSVKGLWSQEKLFSALFEGQVISWTNLNFSDGFGTGIGGRYIPELSLEYKKSEKWKIDGEFSLNAYKAYSFMDEEWTNSGDLKPYRAWIRYSDKQFELRAGLQKINFGSASMLRPLMWFDRLDPRDPLQLTDGVYGILGRYYFLNNANIWLWVLYGNEDPRGWDSYMSDAGKPEMGGRIQLPLLSGEMGISYHFRKLDKDQFDVLPANIFEHDFAQQKVSLDGKWDIGPGVWFESVWKRNSSMLFPDNSMEQQITIGTDYTFNTGNGLTAGVEHLLYSYQKSEFFEKGENANFSALNIAYPLSIMDNLSVIIFYSWENKSWYRFLNWGRQYDKISLYLMTYWNPEGFDIYPNQEGTSLFSGKGFQIMLSYNY